MNLIDGAATEFKTERLIIRKCDPAFTDDLFEAARESIDTVFPWLPWCHPDYQREESLGWLNHCKKEWETGNQYSFSIFNRNNTLLGGCGINKIDQHPVANLGYWLRSSTTGHGFATEATLGLAQFAFNEAGIERLEIMMAITNRASRQVAINAGAEFEGTLKRRLLLHGEMHDAYLYSLVRG
jgi:RimJ/RimL family protein N-acetyltransferase